jgi:hypothetical protein
MSKRSHYAAGYLAALVGQPDRTLPAGLAQRISVWESFACTPRLYVTPDME